MAAKYAETHCTRHRSPSSVNSVKCSLGLLTPGRDCFSKSGIVTVKLSAVTCMFSVFSKCRIVWHLCAEHKAISITVLRVNVFRSSESEGPRFFRYVNTCPMSQVWVYRGVGGLLRKTPLKNRLIKTFSPMLDDSPREISCDTALRATLRVLNDSPSW